MVSGIVPGDSQSGVGVLGGVGRSPLRSAVSDGSDSSLCAPAALATGECGPGRVDVDRAGWGIVADVDASELSEGVAVGRLVDPGVPVMPLFRNEAVVWTEAAARRRSAPQRPAPRAIPPSRA